MNKAEKEVAKSTLKQEKKMLSDLRKVYEDARKSTRENIEALASRRDLQNAQSIIYQMKHQIVIDEQISGILDKLNTNQYKTIDAYLKDAYNNGFVGAMYALQSKGIPLAVPINQKQVIRAVENNSKLSVPLYTKLNENVETMKKDIKQYVSRSVIQNKSWFEIADGVASGMNSPFEKAYNLTTRIARTEGHRIQEQATMDSMQEAKQAGADVVKQWDATLDGNTRPSHMEADGQMREPDEPFDVGGEQIMMPGEGSAGNCINCRCHVLIRPKWALDKEELSTLEGRARFFELDKTKNFEDYKKKYLKIPENAKDIDIPKTFKNATTVKEAEDFAKSIGLDAIYTGVDVRVANAMNEAFQRAINYCPEILQRMKMCGSAQAVNKQFKKELAEWYINNSPTMQNAKALGYSEKEIKKLANNWALRSVGKVPSNCWAFARNQYNSPIAKDVTDKFSGIFVNTKWSYDEIISDLKRSVESKWHPVGCDTLKSIYDHEVAHQLDYLLDLANDPEIKDLWRKLTNKAIKDGLSEYGAKNIREFIAEGYSEYLNNPEPRKFAKTIGKVVEKKVKERKGI